MPQYDEIDALLGLGMQEDPNRMAAALRKQAYAGDIMASTSIGNMQRGGISGAKNARASAKQAGVLEANRKDNALRRTIAANKAKTGYTPKTRALYKNKKTGEVKWITQVGLENQFSDKSFVDDMDSWAEIADAKNARTPIPKTMIRRVNINDPDDQRLTYQLDGEIIDADTQQALSKPSDYKIIPDEGTPKPTGKPQELVHKESGKQFSLTYDTYAREWKNTGGEKEIVDIDEFRAPRARFNTDNVNVAVDDIAMYKTLAELEDELADVTIGTQEGDIPFKRSIEVWAAKKFPTIAKNILGEDAYQELDWEKRKHRWYDMIEKHKLFGSVLTTGEIQSWIDGSVHADSTQAQVMSEMGQLVQMARDKLEGKISGFSEIFNAQDVKTNYTDRMDKIDADVKTKQAARRKEIPLTQGQYEFLLSKGKTRAGLIREGYKVQ